MTMFNDSIFGGRLKNINVLEPLTVSLGISIPSKPIVFISDINKSISMVIE
jgi:hypothetical protein